jgi:hypothetical protein
MRAAATAAIETQSFGTRRRRPLHGVPRLREANKVALAAVMLSRRQAGVVEVVGDADMRRPVLCGVGLMRVGTLVTANLICLGDVVPFAEACACGSPDDNET